MTSPIPSPTESTNGHSDTRVVVLIPTVGGELSRGLRQWLYGANGQTRLSPVVRVREIEHAQPGFIEDIRQYIVDHFLSEFRAPWLLMCDSDTAPRLSALAIARGAEEAGVLMTASPVPFHPFILDETSPRGVHANIFEFDGGGFGKAFRWGEIPWPEKGGPRFWPITSAGFGCTLLHRSVLERLMDAARKGKLDDWPMRGEWRNGRLFRSEDIAFFRRAQKMGFRLYADLANPCNHRKKMTLSPQTSIDDAPFWGDTVHPNAPRDAPEPARAAPDVKDQADA